MAIVKKVFTNTGALQNFTVPAGVSAINLKVWGAAGGPRGAFFSQAGAGGYSSGTVAVVPGQVLDVMVGSKGVAVSTLPTFGGGGGGGAGIAFPGSSGGGRSGVAFSGGNQFIIAGGGGGAGPGSETTANLGGNGGGSSGNTTTFLNGGANLTPAQGGTQVAGGAGATNAVNPGTNGLAGSSLQGGSGGPQATSNGGGGGGGGGYFGGGGGNGASPADAPCETTGGGGSGYINTALLTGATTTGTPQAGALGVVLPPNTADPDYIAGVGVANGAAGTGNGLVVLNFDVAAPLSITKKVSATAAKVGDILTYTLTIPNNGGYTASGVVITDSIPAGTSYVPGSTTANVPIIGDPISSISLINPILSGETVTITYQVTVNVLPTPNPIPNTATMDYRYTPDITPVPVTTQSNTVTTLVFAPSRGVEFI